MAYVLQVNTNGLLSLKESFVSADPHHFPLADVYLIAPFWSDVDIEAGTGKIYYEVHSSATGGTPLQDISKFISSEEDVVFEAEWMLVAEWEKVSQFGGKTTLVNRNSYHVYLFAPLQSCMHM